MLLFSDIFEAKEREWEPKAKAVLTLLCEFYAVNGILDNCGTFLQVSSLFDLQYRRKHPHSYTIINDHCNEEMETPASRSKTVAHSQITFIFIIITTKIEYKSSF